MRSTIGLVILAVGLASSAGVAATHTQVVQCASGSSFQFKLRGGDVRIVKGSDPQHIVVHYTPDPDRPWDEPKVQLRTRVRGSQVQIEIKAPVSLSVETEIEVPSPMALEVHMTGGDLTVEGVDGDKDLHLLAGDMKLRLGSTLNLRQAVVSTRVGDVSAPDVGTTHGWLGNTWKYQGNGQYSLHAHVSFGDVELETE